MVIDAIGDALVKRFKKKLKIKDKKDKNNSTKTNVRRGGSIIGKNEFCTAC